jgi:epoxyqueuosine reductase
VVILEPDGTLEAISPEKAKEYIKSMLPERKKLSESVQEDD